MKHLVRLECDRIKIYRLKKGPRQMVSVASRLYRTDDWIMVKDLRTSDAMAFYDIDDTQPWMVKPTLVDPDMTRLLINSAKLNGSKKSIWADLKPGHLMEYLSAIIVVGALAYGFLISGGF